MDETWLCVADLFEVAQEGQILEFGLESKRSRLQFFGFQIPGTKEFHLNLSAFPSSDIPLPRGGWHGVRLLNAVLRDKTDEEEQIEKDYWDSFKDFGEEEVN